MNQIGAKLAELLLGSGDHTGNLGPLVGQRRHDVTFRHIHPQSQNDRGDYLLQTDMMSAMRLVFMRHDTEEVRALFDAARDADYAELAKELRSLAADAERLNTARRTASTPPTSKASSFGCAVDMPRCPGSTSSVRPAG